MFKSRILVVEDEAVVALGIKNKLEDLGHNVVDMVCNGKDAVEVALKKEPDLILMDILLDGDMDGIEAACKIRNKMDVPIIYLTAFSSEEVFQRLCITEHFQRVCMTEHYAYISKPFSTSAIDVNIEMALHKHKIKKRNQLEVQGNSFQEKSP